MRPFGYNKTETDLLNRLIAEKDEGNKVILSHVLNVLVNGIKCGYMGKFYGENNPTERCLVP